MASFWRSLRTPDVCVLDRLRVVEEHAHAAWIGVGCALSCGHACPRGCALGAAMRAVHHVSRE
eukprot:7212566-Prymnesium_polylepis.1